MTTTMFPLKGYEHLRVRHCGRVYQCFACGDQVAPWRLRIRLAATDRPCDCPPGTSPGLWAVDSFLTPGERSWKCYTRPIGK
jgi:hypothetical protein